MYLKRLELYGFKSFPEKIKLEFNKGITAVVGPNGSGKSNISDAIRWVLGEQSAKSLRGSKMEDVIFAGTENRKPLGFAEVSMVIDNSDYKLPIEYSEVTVTRRVYRSGEGEYKINGAVCRLKDIHQLFMDTGIGKEGYSIIGQGRIDEILSSKSDERRFLFEEAAGIVKYRSRRDDTLIKLEKERQNLLRAEDILKELEAQLEPMYKQAESAKKFLRLKDYQKNLKINIFLVDSDKIDEKINENKSKFENLEEQIKNTGLIRESYLDKIEKLKNKESETNDSYEVLNTELNELVLEKKQKENVIKLITEKKSNSSSQIKRLKSEITNFKSLEKNKSLEKVELERKFLESKTEMQKNQEIISEKEGQYESLKKRLSESESTIENYNTDIIELYKKESDAKSYLDRVNSLYESLEERKEQINSEKEELAEKLNDASNKKENLKLEELERIKNIENIKNKLSKLEDYNNEIEEKYTKLNNENVLLDKEYSAANSRFKIIKELKNDFEGYNKSIKAILEKRNQEGFSGIIGAVGELLEVEPQFETAIEISLGFSVQNIVTKTEEDAKTAIEYLRKNQKGRATFLPLTVIEKRELLNSEKILLEQGVVGIAKDLVSFDLAYEKIVSNLLGRTVVCDTIDNGIILSRKYGNSFRIVTLQGDLLNVGGSMTGGSTGKSNTGIFSRGRELKELSLKIDELKSRKEYLTINLEELETAKISINGEIENLSKDLNKFETELLVLNNSKEQVLEKINELEEKLKDFEIEDKQIMEQIINTKSEIDTYEKTVLSIQVELENIKKSLTEFQNNIISHKESTEESNKELTDLKVSVSKLQENVKSVNENIKRIENEIKDYQINIAKTEEAIIKEENNILRNDEIIKNTINKIEEIKKNYENKQLEIKKASENKDIVKKSIVELESKEREQIEELSLLDKEKARLELKIEQADEQKRKLYDDMWEEYNMTYQQAKTHEKLDLTINELYKEEIKTKEQIKALGDVYVGAIDEYKILKERYDFLIKQRDDILNAEECLLNLIHELTELMSDRFREQFKIISENFSKVFVEMFEGGRAYLKLLDEDNILESGIEIVAQPPGKKLQNMNLLSGGERALTAIALLFAILKMKPSPFCILDEIEAALDDANVKRYADYLKNFSDGTQFIIITHRKGTMVAADVLYGVTMQEQGISKLVSVSLEEAE